MEQTTGDSPFEVGDEVYGLIDFDRDGAAAQYVCVPEQALAYKPATATHAQAAAMALSALTAWQALMNHAELQPGEKVLAMRCQGSMSCSTRPAPETTNPSTRCCAPVAG